MTEEKDIILSNLDFFSKATQDTLSAFHFSGTDNTLYEDIEKLKRELSKVKKRVLVTVEKQGDKYKRKFADGFTDEVEFDELQLPSFFPESVISEKLNKVPSFIYSLKMGDIRLAHDVEIKSNIENLFLL